MLNHTYTSVKNANLVDCGKKQHIASQPSPLLRDNYLGEFRTDLDKKKVLANLGIATELSLEWGNIGGLVGDSTSLTKELNERETLLKNLIKSSTTFESKLDQSEKAVTEVVRELELLLGREQEGEDAQNQYIEQLLAETKSLLSEIEKLRDQLYPEIKGSVGELAQRIDNIDLLLTNITNLITVSNKPSNALSLITAEKATHIWDDSLNEGEGGYREALEGETATHIFDSYINSGEGGYREPISDAFMGLYVPDLSEKVTTATDNIVKLQENVSTILKNFVTKEELGGGDFNFVKQDVFEANSQQVSDKFSTIDTSIEDINKELDRTVKTDEDGHVNTLYVNSINKNNDEGKIQISDSFEVTSGIPLDVRFVVENIEQLTSLSSSICYSGMGVIVNDISALYILRPPALGVALNDTYISNIYNWKCPEDLVTVALSREDYNVLLNKDPNVFYYIYEDEVPQTKEPLREEYETEALYRKAFDEWTNSLKVLSQEYMSAAWGVDIENKLSKKASSQSVSILLSEINNIKGNGNNPSLESLNKSVKDLEDTDSKINTRINEILLKHDESEVGRLVDVENSISEVKEDLKDCVTLKYIQDSSNNFIFVKNDDYIEDKNQFEQLLADKIETKLLTTENIDIQGNTISPNEDRLMYNSNTLAVTSDIPNITVLSQLDYDALENKDTNTYYYTFDGDDIYVTKTLLEASTTKLLKLINVLFTGGTEEDLETALNDIFVPIAAWNELNQSYIQLAAKVEELEARLVALEPISSSYDEGVVNLVGDSLRIYQDGDTLYINQPDITTV